MNVWLIVPYEPLPTIDNTGRYLRYGMFSNELANYSHSVILWMSDFDHVRKVNRFGYTKTINIRDNFNVKLISASAYANNISINRIKHNLQLATNFIEEANTQREKPDIIFACLPTLELAENAVLFAKRVGVPIVIDVVDIWPDVYLSAFPKVLQSAGRFILTSEFYRAKRILRNATAITAVSKTYLSWALKHAGRVKKMEDKIFPLGYTICMSVTNEIGAWQEAFKERYKIASDTILVTFIGQFAKSYDLETVIKAASQFTNNHKLKFILAGDGDKVEKLKKMAEGMDNVIFTGWLNHAAMSGLLSMTSIGLASYSDRALQSLPYKPFEYMAYSLPILSSLNGEFKEIIEGEKIGKYYNALDVNSFCNALHWLLENSDLRTEMGSRAKRLFDQKYNSKVIYADMVSYLENFFPH